MGCEKLQQESLWFCRGPIWVQGLGAVGYRSFRVRGLRVLGCSGAGGPNS